VTALCPTIKPYGWQIDVSEALALGLDATVIAGTGSGKTLPWAMPLLLEENRDRICLVISPLNELEADHVWQRLSLGIVDLTMTLLFLGSIFHREAQNTRGRR
jgi:superfamily II DNA helicase RecQ